MNRLIAGKTQAGFQTSTLLDGDNAARETWTTGPFALVPAEDSRNRVHSRSM
jgi:hypothetical protein